jgi:hypothetical protein
LERRGSDGRPLCERAALGFFLKKSRLLFDSKGPSIQNNDPTLSSLDPHVLYRSSILNPQSSLDTSSILTLYVLNPQFIPGNANLLSSVVNIATISV